ncbi:MAG: hypothetical protein WDZ30_03190 [Cellvibrionaceae bacterium]
MTTFTSTVSSTCLFIGLVASAWAAANDYEPPRTPDGKPSLQGIWTNVSVTDLQRKEGVDKLVLTPQEAAEIEGRDFYNIRIREDAKPNSEEESNTLLDGSDLLSGGGYNAFWVDPGETHGVVKGEIRSSWIIDPADGRIPFSEQGRAKLAERRAERERSNDGPEGRTLSDRCLIGFGGTGGPPMLNVLYNNTYQIVQTPDHIMILVEMVHDARIIPIGDQHRPEELYQWLGDSVAHWEGDTLVVETVNWNPWQGRRGPVYMSEKGKVVERFTRYSDNEILYEFTVEDPEYYSQVWHGEMTFIENEGPVYEYACHEGNIALPGILQGARVQEARGEVVTGTEGDEE